MRSITQNASKLFYNLLFTNTQKLITKDGHFLIMMLRNNSYGIIQ